jgi:hypothetical protein
MHSLLQAKSVCRSSCAPDFCLHIPLSWLTRVKVLVRRSLYVRSLTGVLQFGAGKRDSLATTSSVPLGSPGGCSSKKTCLKKEKILRKDWGNTSVTGGLRTGDNQKFESIRINLRDLAWSQVCPRDPGLLQTWIPGTRPGTTPGIPSKCQWGDVVYYSMLRQYWWISLDCQWDDVVHNSMLRQYWLSHSLSTLACTYSKLFIVYESRMRELDSKF